MRRFGLIGKTLKHSFSGNYFAKKFQSEGITDCRYDLFELSEISELPSLFQDVQPVGLNVTIPYKEQVIPYLSALDESAKAVGAVNVIYREGDQLTGFNSDYYGFSKSLEVWLNQDSIKALVLGTGGASKAVVAALRSLSIPFQQVSRGDNADLTYAQITEDIGKDYKLWINTTPLGTFPDINEAPDMPYASLTSNHFLYDLVYNPEVTRFMSMGKSAGAETKNGLEMLYLQAERSWEIWNS